MRKELLRYKVEQRFLYLMYGLISIILLNRIKFYTLSKRYTYIPIQFNLRDDILYSINNPTLT